MKSVLNSNVSLSLKIPSASFIVDHFNLIAMQFENIQFEIKFSTKLYIPSFLCISLIVPVINQLLSQEVNQLHLFFCTCDFGDLLKLTCMSLYTYLSKLSKQNFFLALIGQAFILKYFQGILRGTYEIKSEELAKHLNDFYCKQIMMSSSTILMNKVK